MLLPHSNLLSDVEAYVKKELSTHYSSGEIEHFCQYLFEEFSEISKNDRLTKKKIYIPESEIIKYSNAIRKLKAEMPIQYIIGKANFYGFDFFVDKSVLIPRPETEELVEWICQELTTIPEAKILDIGTGSACIPIVLAKKNQKTSITAVDISHDALKIATKNADFHQANIQFMQADALKPSSLPHEKFDIIVSNPPYVRDSEKSSMHRNVMDYESHLALFVDDNDPLIFYKNIAKYSFQHLSENGKLFFEINEALGKECQELLTEIGFKNIEIRIDLRGKERMICGEL